MGKFNSNQMPKRLVDGMIQVMMSKFRRKVLHQSKKLDLVRLLLHLEEWLRLKNLLRQRQRKISLTSDLLLTHNRITNQL